MQKENHIFKEKVFLGVCFVMSYSYVSCLIHKTEANVINRICQMSKKLGNLQKKYF